MKFAAFVLSGAALAAAVPSRVFRRTDYHEEHEPEKPPMVMDLPSPFTFTSTYQIIATPGQVVNGDNEYTGGLPGTIGYYNYGINSMENVICYNITLYGFRGEYQSAADTATHIHEAPVGMAGPPRVAFPNPMNTTDPDKRVSLGCLKGPFETGIVVNGTDTAEGFHISEIEDDPAAFFTDVHSSLAVPGAVRGQVGSGVCT